MCMQYFCKTTADWTAFDFEEYLDVKSKAAWVLPKQM